MSDYRGKLLELKSIENESDKYWLHIELYFYQDIEILWKIDEYTAENLKSAAQFDKKYKYRLSFNSFWDVTQNQHKSMLTRTYLDQSDSIYFPCSKDYIDNLAAIKHSQDISNLDRSIFTFMDLVPVYEKNKDGILQDEGNTSKNYSIKFIRKPLTVIGIIFIILFSCSGFIYLNKFAFNEKVLAESIQLEQLEQLENDVAIKQNENMELGDDRIIEEALSNEPDIPFIEIDETISYSIPEGYVALTFDDGPSQYSMEIMEVLKKYEVGGTFFFTGYNAKKYPDHIRYIQSNGYSIGSHSMSHVNMAALSCEEQEKELVQSIKLLEEITNDKVTLFRAPYGSFDKHLKDLINENQYKMILWNNDPKDWKSRDADKIFDSIKASNVSGSIILLHESQAVIDALPRIIEYLQELDLKIVSIK
ncbi:polysaccharide deacetylase family protein [Proteiniborus sp. MB09-C3]|uniref:polysaccharide deacetylase family protein n=1 Tax=Proteiniborus sp. MB09-C3 TaxID=3050072 RepID=UPI002556B65C|nr:polysaccharide deacetylase family protein [Proteiniborus sp. MB09-C3]WIV12449.1 polysaccharide deacetylase family protein [Proteiniborus sp. MB09-C3]